MLSAGCVAPFPERPDLATLSDAQFAHLIRAYNNTPRKCLDYRTPAEIFSAQVLHLKCESTLQPPLERRSFDRLRAMVRQAHHERGLWVDTLAGGAYHPVESSEVR